LEGHIGCDCYKRWRKTTRSKEIKRKKTRDNVENPLNTRGKTTGDSQQELHYDRSLITNANGGGLQEIE
jgi:hypothetical protein